MAAKCNITSLTLQKLNQLFWGVKTKSVDDAILENYIEKLNYNKCVELVICNEADCFNEPIVVVCILSVLSIQVTKSENVVIFSIPNGGILNGTPPYSYEWTYESDDFIPAGAIDLETATLTVTPSKDINYLISNVSVRVTDSNGCTATKSCWLIPSGMQCTENYAACVPVSTLIVTNKVVLCGVLKSLVVSKKL